MTLTHLLGKFLTKSGSIQLHIRLQYNTVISSLENLYNTDLFILANS